MKIELLISPVDKERSRRKAGDIIGVMPAGHIWGSAELENYIVVPYECAEKDFCQLQGQLLSKGDAGEKRKYCVPIPTLKACYDYDDEKVETLYQPFITDTRYKNLPVEQKVVIDCADTVEPILTGDVVYDKTARDTIKILSVDIVSEAVK